MGSNPREDVSARLMESDDQYRALVEEHSAHDRRLDELSARRFPSNEEQTEELRLKKLKLQLKDRMQTILHQRALEAV